MIWSLLSIATNDHNLIVASTSRAFHMFYYLAIPSSGYYTHNFLAINEEDFNSFVENGEDCRYVIASECWLDENGCPE